MSKFERFDAYLNSFLAILFGIFIGYNWWFLISEADWIILTATGFDQKMAGRLTASVALFMNLIFIKCFGGSTGTSVLTGLKNL